MDTASGLRSHNLALLAYFAIWVLREMRKAIVFQFWVDRDSNFCGLTGLGFALALPFALALAFGEAGSEPCGGGAGGVAGAGEA